MALAMERFFHFNGKHFSVAAERCFHFMEWNKRQRRGSRERNRWDPLCLASKLPFSPTAGDSLERAWKEAPELDRIPRNHRKT